MAPDGSDFLILGHEGFGRVEAVGPMVSFIRPGDFVVATVRRPGSSIYDAIGLQDMTTDSEYFERGIDLSERVPDRVPRGGRRVRGQDPVRSP